MFRKTGKSKGITKRESRATDIKPPNTRINGIYSPFWWCTSVRHTLINPPVRPHLVWYCQEISLEQQYSSFRWLFLWNYQVTWLREYCVVTICRDWPSWEGKLTVDWPRRKWDTSKTTIDVYKKHRSSKRRCSCLLTGDHLRWVRTIQKRRINRHKTSWCQG